MEACKQSPTWAESQECRTFLFFVWSDGKKRVGRPLLHVQRTTLLLRGQDWELTSVHGIYLNFWIEARFKTAIWDMLHRISCVWSCSSVIYLPLFEDAGDRLTTQFSLYPKRGCEPADSRGSDRKTRKCQNSISKQTVNIVTLFMLNKKRSVLILTLED